MRHRPVHTDLAQLRAKDLRRNASVSEKRLWVHIRGGATGARFRRQVPIGRWIADFASFDPPIVIGVDGEDHIYPEDPKMNHLAAEGFTVIRVSNRDVATDPLGVVGYIADVVADLRRSTS
ncbi:MAG: DUF559 domain-containing protein [Acidimicrobiia bacterium]|nr:DUF559 domain-containing protein [Acidimicrobiia bacterium]